MLVGFFMIFSTIYDNSTCRELKVIYSLEEPHPVTVYWDIGEDRILHIELCDEIWFGFTVNTEKVIKPYL